MSAKMPKYIELYSKLRHSILDGEFPVDSFLPTENELMDRYQVSKTTIRHAVKLLKEHNMVEVRQGSGTKILPLEQELVAGTKYQTPGASTSVLIRYNTKGSGEVHNTRAVIDTVPADGMIAEALEIPPETMVYRLQRLQLVDGAAYGYMVNYITLNMAPDLPSKGEIITDLYGHLYKHYGIEIHDIEETVDSIVAGFMEAQYLQVDAGTPLIILHRVAKSKTTPVEYCETTVRPDLYKMIVKITSPIISKEDSLL